jgi:preprotein translocase subunit YajC
LLDLLRNTQLLLASSQGGAAGGPQALIANFLPLVLVFAIFYFLLIRPQQKKQQQLQQMLGNLKRGDKVITTGGMYGTIEGLDEKTVQLKIASQVKVTMSRSAIAGLQPTTTTTETTTEE